MHSIGRAINIWGNLPGNWDPLHSRELYTSDNEYGIPTIKKNGQVPSHLTQWGSRPDLLAVEEGRNTAVHFFIDDYRFESLWKDPMRNIDALMRIGCVLSPDFSLFRDMPVVMQMWNVYRNRWLGRHWQTHGIKVIPTISWSKPHDFCYAGIPHGSIVAISSVGLGHDQAARYLFREGFEKMIDVLDPEVVLIYGKLPSDMQTTTPVVTFSTRWEQRKSAQVGDYVNLLLW